MDVTLFGIETETREVAVVKALSPYEISIISAISIIIICYLRLIPIDVTPVEIIRLVIFKQFPNV